MPRTEPLDRGARRGAGGSSRPDDRAQAAPSFCRIVARIRRADEQGGGKDPRPKAYLTPHWVGGPYWNTASERIEEPSCGTHLSARIRCRGRFRILERAMRIITGPQNGLFDSHAKIVNRLIRPAFRSNQGKLFYA